jgi:hypothetical protein
MFFSFHSGISVILFMCSISVDSVFSSGHLPKERLLGRETRLLLMSTTLLQCFEDDKPCRDAMLASLKKRNNPLWETQALRLYGKQNNPLWETQALRLYGKQNNPLWETQALRLYGKQNSPTLSHCPLRDRWDTWDS